MPSTSVAVIQAFITRWQVAGAAERANAHLFIAELCDVLGVEHPQPKKPEETANAYVFEKTIPSITDSSNFIDLYKRGCFVLETKQGVEKHEGSDPLSALHELAKKQRKTGHGVRGSKGWDTAMLRAKEQAQRYARALPKEEIAEGRPPFILVVDVGHSIALYTDWSRMGGEYIPYPDPATFRIALKDLVRPEVRKLLSDVWTDPLSLDPNRRSAKVTREIADRLAKLARSLEGKHTPEDVSGFLMRCLFTMFSEDVELLPHGSFTRLLGELKSDPGNFKEMLENLWGTMNTGGLSPILRKKLPRFNGGLFAHADAIALDADQIQLLIEASTANWKDVEPAIFGTLLERALDPRERHKLGAHYTPRAYVERLVNPTVIEPLREQWKSVQVAALQLAEDYEDKKAIKLVEKFLFELGNVRVLDPACGSGNFLYVTLELLKRLEGEVLNTLQELGQVYKLEYDTHTVTPANFFGIELNPRAAAIAEQVLWIGFLQWQLRTHGNLHNLPEPIIKDLHNIQNRDAVLEWDSVESVVDDDGRLVTRWDGHTTKPHPVTGEEVPDPMARAQVFKYHNPKPAKWPAADYIVGNPPFIGARTIRAGLSDSYVDSLRVAHPDVPDTCDFVLFWWNHAAELVAKQKLKAFGLITTNSISQSYSRKLLDRHLGEKGGVSLRYVVPDHPWVESGDGADVRIAMTVGVQRKSFTGAVLGTIVTETEGDVRVLEQPYPLIDSTLRAVSLNRSVPLKANEDVCFQGVVPAGSGFKLTPEEVQSFGYSINALPVFLRPYIIGRDVVQAHEHKYIIDFFGWTEERVKSECPALYQHLRDRVWPERNENNRKTYRNNWWIFAEPRPKMRKCLQGLSRFIVTPYTAKFRPFTFVDGAVLPDAMAYAIAHDDACVLGTLSSKFHVEWSLAAGGRMGVGNDPRYNSSKCFDPFPFPTCTPAQQAKIRALGEQLDAHRKRQQALYSELTMTGMYNVLEAVRASTALTAKEKKIYDQGLVGILKQLHDEVDAAVAEAYGWPANLSTEDILTRLVALNAERAAEEAKGTIRWLRPEYQNKGAAKVTQGKMAVEEDVAAPAASATVREWPDELPAQAAALTEVLGSLNTPTSVEDLAAHFEGKRTKKRLEEMTRLLETLAAVGRARSTTGKWIGSV